MKKILLSSLLVLSAFFLFGTKALANEGSVRLTGKTEAEGRCFAASVYIEGSYKILLTCRGLQMALDPVFNKYVVWAGNSERKHRLGEIVSGKMQASTGEKFDTLLVTLEADGYPTKPGDVVLTGNVEAIDFGKGMMTTVLTPTVTGAQEQTKIDERGALVPTPTVNNGRLTGAVVGIGKAILFGFILLLIVVGVMSFLARRKNL